MVESDNLTGEQLKAIEWWKNNAKNKVSGEHFDFKRHGIDMPEKVKSLVREVVSPDFQESNDTLVDIFGSLHSAKRQKSNIVDNNRLEVFKRVFSEMLESDSFREEWNDEIAYAGGSIMGELFGWLHIASHPIYNSCAEYGLGFFGFPVSGGYSDFEKRFDEFKEFYLEKVGRINSDVPINVEIDQLFNVVHKHPLFKKEKSKSEVRYWNLTPSNDKSAWVTFVENGCIGGLTWLGDVDLSTVGSRDELESLLIERKPEYGEGETDPVQIAKMYWDFSHEIKKGDFIVANRGKSKVLGIGKVVREYYFDEDADKYKHKLGVKWQDTTPREVSTMHKLERWVVPLKKEEFERLSGRSSSEVRFWQIAPGKKAKYWDRFRDEGVIAIGWDGTLDLSDVTEKDEIIEILYDVFPELYSETSPSQSAGRIFSFVNEVQVGDYIVANKGKSGILGVGRVKSDYYFDDSAENYKHRRKVDWFDTNFRQIEKTGKFGTTLVELSREEFEDFTGIKTEKRMQVEKSGSELEFSGIDKKVWDLLRRKNQVIFYGPPGTGKTWHAKLFVWKFLAQKELGLSQNAAEEYARIKMKEVNDELSEDDEDFLNSCEGGSEFSEPTIPDEFEFDGFSSEAFDFYKNTDMNSKWSNSKRDVYRREIRDKFKFLFSDLAKVVKQFEPTFETERNVLSRPWKRSGGYYPYFWGAFYRKEREKKQNDFQIFVSINEDEIRCGIWCGKDIEDLLDRFRSLVSNNLDKFYDFIKSKKLTEKYEFYNSGSSYGVEEIIKIKNKNDIEEWVEGQNFGIALRVPKDEAVSMGDELVRKFIDAIIDLYPIYNIAINSDFKLVKGRKSLDRFSELIIFHQSYSYEEFVEGIKPKLGGELESDDESSSVVYKIEPGIFKRVCKRARSNPEDKYFLIIDEINRGKISKILGELIYSLEYRDEGEAKLTYSKEKFSVPSNLFIIGTMNTADRSIALLDVALRRRFGFVHFPPKYDILFEKLLGEDGEVDNSRISSLSDDDPLELSIKALHCVNQKIRVLLDEDHTIGHTYLLNVDKKDSLADLRLVWYHEIIPLVCEYFYGDWVKIKEVLGDFVSKGEPSVSVENGVYRSEDDDLYSINDSEVNFVDCLRSITGSIKSEK